MVTTDGQLYRLNEKTTRKVDKAFKSNLRSISIIIFEVKEILWNFFAFCLCCGFVLEIIDYFQRRHFNHSQKTILYNTKCNLFFLSFSPSLFLSFSISLSLSTPLSLSRKKWRVHDHKMFLCFYIQLNTTLHKHFLS